LSDLNFVPALPLASRLSVCCLDPLWREHAQAFCRQHHLTLAEVAPEQVATPLVLVYADNDCYLQPTGPKAPGPVRASFVDGAVEHRRRFGGGKGQMIAKAVGLNKGVTPSVLDATAGLGRDAWVLASLGCEVQMLERSPVIAELLRFALDQAHRSELADIAARLSLKCIDAHAFLAQQQEPCADVIYLDPMYPHRDKSAAVKKEMKLFQGLIGADSDAHTLLDLALTCARHRVVVKRPARGETLTTRQPDYQLPGKSCRYDIYTLKRLA
jgi:16S rRNA (guanine1516-N2)-methyltransferase